MTGASAVEHAISSVERSRRGRVAERRFACACGTVGPWRGSAAAALGDFRAHAGIRVVASRG